MAVLVSVEEKMADPKKVEEVTPEEAEDFGFWDNDPRTVPEHYIKAFDVNGVLSEATLLLGSTYDDGRKPVNFCKVRLIMSHSDFLDFAEAVRKEAALLTKLYKGTQPGPNVTREEFDTAWEEIYGGD